MQLSRGRAVLEGRDDSPQQQIARDMATASASLSYERAGWLRDRLTALQQLEEQLARVRDALTRPSFVYLVPGVHGDGRLYLIRNGRVADEAPCGDELAVRRLQGRVTNAIATPLGADADELDELLMIEQWFRTRPESRPTSRTTRSHTLWRRQPIRRSTSRTRAALRLRGWLA